MTGRWPANVILSPGMAEVLDEQSGDLRTGAAKKGGQRGGAVGWASKDFTPRDDPGGASKYYLNAGYEPWELEWIYSVGLRPCGMEGTA